MSENTGSEESSRTTADVPIMQKLFNSIWFLAGIAILFFLLSYVVWGFIDLLTIPLG